MAVRIVLWAANRDADRISELIASDARGNSIFIKEFAGDAVEVFFAREEVPGASAEPSTPETQMPHCKAHRRHRPTCAMCVRAKAWKEGQRNARNGDVS